VFEFLALAERLKKEIERIQIGKEVKVALLVYDMILYLKTIQTPPKKFLVLLNTISKVAGYKISIQKSVAFLRINNEQEIRKTTQFIMASKNKKENPEINLTKEVKDLSNNTTLEKEIEEDIRKWKDLPCSWTSRIYIVKMTILPKAIYRFNAIPIKTIHRHRKINPKIHIEA
jgi:tRNA nucleotidyltransferase/poly(A) polymerase